MTNTVDCGTNYLAPSGFRVTIDRKNFPNLQFYAQTVQHPNATLNAVEVGYRRSPIGLVGDTIDFSTLTMDVLLDEEMRSYNELYNWMESAVEQKHNNSATNLLKTNNTATPSYYDITVSVLSSHNNVIRSFRYINAFPIDIGSINFSASDQENFITFPATFRFDYFEFA